MSISLYFYISISLYLYISISLYLYLNRRVWWILICCQSTTIRAEYHWVYSRWILGYQNTFGGFTEYLVTPALATTMTRRPRARTRARQTLRVREESAQKARSWSWHVNCTLIFSLEKGNFKWSAHFLCSTCNLCTSIHTLCAVLERR